VLPEALQIMAQFRDDDTTENHQPDADPRDESTDTLAIDRRRLAG
jgi:hypothetical protein